MSGKFELKQARNKKFMFSLKSGNGRMILTSERYNTKQGMEVGIASVARCAPDAEVVENM